MPLLGGEDLRINALILRPTLGSNEPNPRPVRRYGSVALLVRFVPFSSFLRDTRDLSGGCTVPGAEKCPPINKIFSDSQGAGLRAS
jgi:hypothetical protein